MQEGYSEEERHEIAKRYKDLLTKTYVTLSKEDKRLIRKAMDMAVDAHKGQKRKSGEAYIYHPIAVAKIVSQEIGLDAIAIMAALLHDVVEDSDYTLDNISHVFNEKVAKIIDGLTKISEIKNQNISAQAENYRKLLFTLSEDIRVILIKLADRLHNMRTMEAMPREKQKNIASETLYIFAPLAHRLGLYNIKMELEDLSVKYLEPRTYRHILKKLEDSKQARKEYIEAFSKSIREALDKAKIKYQIKGRPKSIYSIKEKMNKQGVPFEDIYDIFALRIIYKATSKDERFLIWKIYSIVTNLYYQNPKRFRDWISHPKSTGYESLHTTVMGPQGRWVEIQIRSERMHEIAEKGIAAHYKYKYGFQENEEKGLEGWLNRVREILETEHSNSTTELIDNFKLNLYSKEIYVFTHKGDLISLPKGATTLDFAYTIHSCIGDSALGAKVNGKIMPLKHVLQSGDQVEIINGVNQKPKIDWLDMVITSKARSKIKSALNVERKKIADQGKEMLERKLRHHKIKLNENTLKALVNFFKVSTSQEIFYKIGNQIIDSQEIKLFSSEFNKPHTVAKKGHSKKSYEPSPAHLTAEKKYNNLLVFNHDYQDLAHTLASCCNPIPGDPVFGFITIGQSVRVHRENCPNAVSLRANYKYRIIKAQWTNSPQEDFEIRIKLEGFDRTGIIKDIGEVIAQHIQLNVKSINISSKDHFFEGILILEVKSKYQVDDAIEQLKNISDIKSVKRIDVHLLHKHEKKSPL